MSQIPCNHLCINCGHSCTIMVDAPISIKISSPLAEDVHIDELKNHTEQEIEEIRMVLILIKDGEQTLNNELKWMDDNHTKLIKVIEEWCDTERLINTKVQSWNDLSSNYTSTELTEAQLKEKINRKDLEHIDFIISSYAGYMYELEKEWNTDSDAHERLLLENHKFTLQNIKDDKDTSLPKEHHALIVKLYESLRDHSSNIMNTISAKIERYSRTSKQLQNDYYSRSRTLRANSERADAKVELNWVKDRITEHKFMLENERTAWIKLKKQTLDNYNSQFTTDLESYNADTIKLAQALLDKPTEDDIVGMIVRMGISTSGQR